MTGSFRLYAQIPCRFKHFNMSLNRDLRWLPYLHLLVDLSFWTGVGYQTTRGMGQVRKVNL
ncbi:MAG: hypothetical protein Kow00117_01750 [Phototrophicales bacterium]